MYSRCGALVRNRLTVINAEVKRCAHRIRLGQGGFPTKSPVARAARIAPKRAVAWTTTCACGPAEIARLAEEICSRSVVHGKIQHI